MPGTRARTRNAYCWCVGLIAWYIIEKYYCEYPTVPFALLMNRTTVIGYFTTFMHGILALALFFYW
jgi:hypothetical protein